MQVELMRFRKNSDFIDIGNFEVGIYEIGLIAIRDESPLTSSGFAGRFGTWPLRYTPFRDNSIRIIVTSGHIISGQARFGIAQLHYFKLGLLCTDSSLGKSVQAPIRYY